MGVVQDVLVFGVVAAGAWHPSTGIITASLSRRQACLDHLCSSMILGHLFLFQLSFWSLELLHPLGEVRKNPSAHATRLAVVEGFLDKEQRT